MNILKIIFFIFFCFVSLIGCNSKKEKISDPVVSEIKDLRLATDFTDEGVKVFYTLTGKLKSIEVTGQSEVWKKNVEALAEADALAKLTKYIYGTDVTTNRRLQIIGKSMEKFNDNILKSLYKGDEIPVFNDKQVEKEILASVKNLDFNVSNQSSKKNYESDNQINRDLISYKREAEVLNNSIVETVTKISAAGKLQGVRKLRDFTRDNGKVYVVVYVWTDKDIDTTNYLKQRMQTK
jgi:hypothetical protein